MERCRRVMGGPEQGLVRTDQRDLDALAGKVEGATEEGGMRLGVGHDEIHPPERDGVDRAQHLCRRRARPEASAIADQRVMERDEWVEDDGPPPRDPPRRRDVEVTRVAHDDDVGVVRLPPRERSLRARDPRELAGPDSPVVSSPDLAVPLDDGHTGAAQTGDDLGVPGRRTVVRPEVESLHAAVSSAGSRRRASKSGRRGLAAARGADSSPARRAGRGRGTGCRPRPAGRRAAATGDGRSAPRSA